MKAQAECHCVGNKQNKMLQVLHMHEGKHVRVSETHIEKLQQTSSRATIKVLSIADSKPSSLGE